MVFREAGSKNTHFRAPDSLKQKIVWQYKIQKKQNTENLTSCVPCKEEKEGGEREEAANV